MLLLNTRIKPKTNNSNKKILLWEISLEIDSWATGRWLKTPPGRWILCFRPNACILSKHSTLQSWWRQKPAEEWIESRAGTYTHSSPSGVRSLLHGKTAFSLAPSGTVVLLLCYSSTNATSSSSRFLCNRVVVHLQNNLDYSIKHELLRRGSSSFKSLSFLSSANILFP